jgi:hypothetical protein
VVAVRTFLNQAEAALEKSRLDDYGILCELAHENAHLYGGGPFAMPIQLLVDEDQAEEALRVLDGDVETAADIGTTPRATDWPSATETRPEVVKNNPWELLAIAALFLLPALCVLRVKYPAVIPSGRRASGAIAAVAIIHFFGWLAIGFAAFLIALFFRVSRSSAGPENGRDADAANHRAREKP